MRFVLKTYEDLCWDRHNDPYGGHLNPVAGSRLLDKLFELRSLDHTKSWSIQEIVDHCLRLPSPERGSVPMLRFRTERTTTILRDIATAISAGLLVEKRVEMANTPSNPLSETDSSGEPG